MENADKNKKETVNYYGKKNYRLNPLIARMKLAEPKEQQFWFEDVDDKKVR